MPEEKESQKQAQKIESLLQEIEAMADPNLRAKAVELVQALMDFHAAGLERLMEIIARSGENGPTIIDKFARDNLVGSLLLLYGLHPLDLETRVRQALAKLQPYLNGHKARVESLGITGGIVRLQLAGGSQSCTSSALSLQKAVEEAIYEAAPDVTELQVSREPPASISFVPLSSLRGK